MDVDNADSSVVWGRSILEPERGHVREPETYLVDSEVVGFAICGAWLVGDLLDQGGDFPRCSTCVALLDEQSHG